MKLRVKTKIRNGDEFEYLLESEQKIFNMFGKKWSSIDHENDCSDQVEIVTIALDHDLGTSQELYQVPDDHNVDTFERQPCHIEDQTLSNQIDASQSNDSEICLDDSFSEDLLSLGYFQEITGETNCGVTRGTTRGRPRGRARGGSRVRGRGGSRVRTRGGSRGVTGGITRGSTREGDRVVSREITRGTARRGTDRISEVKARGNSLHVVKVFLCPFNFDAN